MRIHAVFDGFNMAIDSQNDLMISLCKNSPPVMIHLGVSYELLPQSLFGVV